MGNASRDQNYVTTLLGVSSADGVTPIPVRVDPVTGRVLTQSPSGGTGTVTSVSVATANGISGTVATATTTPVITLSLGAITPTSVNGLTISSTSGTLTISNLKTLTVSNTLTFTGTDGSSVNFGTGGTVLYSGGALGTPSSGNASNLTNFPTLNQNTTGSAASLSITGQSGLLTFLGLTSTNRAKTVRDAADTILELGGSYTPTGAWTNMPLTSPKITTAITDANGNEVIKTPATTSAVNDITVANAATGNAPSISATGDDTNIDLNMGAKGTGKIRHTSGVYGNITADTDGATVTFDMSVSNIHTVTLGGNRTLALSNVAVGQCFMLRLKQDATGSRTVTWFSTISWAGGSAPTLTTTANKADMIGLVCTGSGTYDGFVVGQNI